MINFHECKIDIAKAADEHFSFFKCYVQKRLSILHTQPCQFAVHMPGRRESSKSRCFLYFRDFVSEDDNLEKILKGLPSHLMDMHHKFEALTRRLYGRALLRNYQKSPEATRKTLGDIHTFYDDVAQVFNYGWFNSLQPSDDYSGYKLAENLNIRSCTYCNRSYTVTRSIAGKGKLMRPEFDHWFPESKFPLLAISFYNLIPCCTHCNRTAKNDIDLNLADHTHPYIAEQNDSFSFDYFYSKALDKFRIFIKKPHGASGKHYATMIKLRVDEMYNAHHPELEDLLRIRQAYGTKYIEEMQAFFPKTGLSKEEIYLLLFGVEYDSANFHKRPFSKFKKDILKELGMIP